MAQSLLEYKKDYLQLRRSAAVIFGMAAGCGLSQNYFGLIWTLFIGILQKKMSDNAYKRSSNCYEYQLLNGIYVSVREELVNNIKTLDMTDLEGIFAYYCHIILNNYLSYDRHLPKYHVEVLFNEEPILAALTLNNHGVCRNIAPFLTDLYHDFNIDSKNIVCDYYESIQEIIIDANEYISKEDIKNLEEKETLEETIQEMNNIFERIANDLKEKGTIGRERKEHHCINLVNDKEHSYLLDASTAQFYVDKDEEGKYPSNRGDYFKVVNNRKLEKLYKSTMSTKLEIPHPLKSAEEMISDLNKRQKHIKDNADIIEQMHKDIEPMLVTAEEVYKLILQAR